MSKKTCETCAHFSIDAWPIVYVWVDRGGNMHKREAMSPHACTLMPTHERVELDHYCGQYRDKGETDGEDV